MNIEVEIRSFLTKERYGELIEFFHKNAEFVSEDEQETIYFDSLNDVRIQKNNYFSKIWMKKGVIHDETREEIEIKCDREDFNKLLHIFEALGHKISIKWFRKRYTFNWKEGIVVTLDFTKGYGYIIELEKMASEETKDKTLILLKDKFESLKIESTPKEVFKEKYEYQKNSVFVWSF